MHIYTISGSSVKPLIGRVQCSGAKNVAVKALIAALLTDEEVILYNLPEIGDVQATIQLLQSLGVECKYRDRHTLSINAATLRSESDLHKANRTVISLFGILAHRFDTAVLPALEGCALGERKVDIHLNIYEQFGIEVEDKYMRKNSALTGQDIILPYPSVGATETALFLAVLAQGTSLIKNIALEPEVMQIISMLQLMGANIRWLNANTLLIKGVKRLRGAKFTIMPDRLEVATWSVLALISNGSITVTNTRYDHLQSFLGAFIDLGGGVEQLAPDTLRFYRERDLQQVDLSANVWPSLATDQLPQLSVPVAFVGGSLHDTLYETRMLDVHEMLNKFGIQNKIGSKCQRDGCRFSGKYQHYINVIGNSAPITVATELTLPKNIRCAQAYLLLASQVNQELTLNDPTHSIARGYEDLIKKMQSVGLEISFTEINI